jgi:hypothetical protein
MKNIPVVLIILLLSIPVFAQYDSVKTSGLPVYNNIVNPKLKSFSGYEKKQTGFIHTNKQPDFKRFIEMYNKKQLADKTSSRRLTCMDGPVVYSAALPDEISKNANTLYQRYSASFAQPSAALQILGLVGGITAGIFYHDYSGIPIPSYTGGYDRTRYLGNRAAIEAAYLQSTYFQHDK